MRRTPTKRLGGTRTQLLAPPPPSKADVLIEDCSIITTQSIGFVPYRVLVPILETFVDARKLLSQPTGRLLIFTNNCGNYNRCVARGWESKSVEAQQAEAGDRSTATRAKLTVKEAATIREKESLHLSRQRVLQQIEASANPQHRKMLEDALAELDERLRRLE